MTFFEIEEETMKLFKLSSDELHRRGVEALLTQELKHAEEQLFSLIRLQAIQNAFEKSLSVNEDRLEPRGGHSKVARLKTRINSIKMLLEKLRWSESNPD